MIFGLPGAGKSTFAHKLAKTTGLPVFHLDKYFFTSNWAVEESTLFLKALQDMTRQPAWIIEGNNSKTFAERWSKADLVVYFHFGKWRCLLRLLKRRIVKNRDIDDRAPGCDERLRFQLIRYLWGYHRRVHAVVRELKARYPSVEFLEICSDYDLQRVDNLVQESCQ